MIQTILCGLLITNIIMLAARPTLPLEGHFRFATTARNNTATHLFNLTLPTITTRYGTNPSYMSLSPTLDWLWTTDANPQTGLIQLSPPNPDGTIRWGEIAMFHQLHCLSSLRTALQHSSLTNESIGIDYHDDKHWPHCLHYLRQTILCYADDTIEVPSEWEESKRVGSIDGAEDLRLCRDSEGLRGLVAKRGVGVLKGDGEGQ